MGLFGRGKAPDRALEELNAQGTQSSGVTDSLVDWYLNPDEASPVLESAVSSARRPTDIPEDLVDGGAHPILEGVQRAIADPMPAGPSQLPVRFEKPPLTDELVELKRQAKEALSQRLGMVLSDTSVSEDELHQLVIDGLADFLISVDTSSYSEQQLDQLGSELVDDVLGHGPIEPLLQDDLVSEIMVNGPDHVFVERAGRLFETSAKFDSDAHVRRVIDRIVARIGRRIDESSPMVDARLPDGSRVNAIIPPLARKFSKSALTEQDLVGYQTLTWDSVALLQAFVSGRMNVLISGGTGTGKTTLLNVCDDRRLGRAPPEPTARCATRISSAQRRGQRCHRDPRPRKERTAYAARPHRRR